MPKLSDPPHLYANPSQQDLRLTLLEAIRRAHSSIHLVMFGLSDPPLLSLLAQKIKEAVPTTVYYDPTGSPSLRQALAGGDIHPIHQSGLMHQKILILDNETIFIGSANFTTASLKMHDNLVIGFTSRNVARFLKEKAARGFAHLRATAGGQGIELWLLPDPRGHALADLCKKIDAARQKIRLALFTLTHEGLVHALIRAARRGVNVSLVIDGHSGFGASRKAAEKLQKEGVHLFFSQGVQLLHHKFALFDEQTLVTGSANWTKAAFAKNSDCLLILYNLNSEQKTFLNRLWRRIEQQAKLIEPTSGVS